MAKDALGQQVWNGDLVYSHAEGDPHGLAIVTKASLGLTGITVLFDAATGEGPYEFWVFEDEFVRLEWNANFGEPYATSAQALGKLWNEMNGDDDG